MPQSRNQVSLICEQCHQEFQVKASFSKNRRFCGWKCRVANGLETQIITNCENCGKEISTYKANPQKYCSISCGTSARNKTDTNPSKHRDVSGKNNPMFGKGFFGKNNPMFGKTGNQNPAWRGGRKIRKDGYILVYVPDHPHAISDGAGKRTYILEHRLVMEQYIGRYLLPDEVVHHKDSNPSNNDISNLELFSSQSEHISKGHSG